MKPELKNKIIAFNRLMKEKGEKASDLEILIDRIMTLPAGQLNKILTEDILEILRKHGAAV